MSQAYSANTYAAARFTVGPILAGTFLNLVLFGVSLAQFYLYYRAYARKDKTSLRIIVSILLLLDILNSVFLMALSYDALVNHFGDIDSVTRSSGLIASDPILSAMIGIIVQCFFAWRIKILTGKTWICCCIVALATIANVGGLATGAAVAGWIRVYTEFQRFHAPVIVWLAGNVVCDSSITIILVWRLRSYKTGFSNTDDMIDGLVRLTVQTGLITTLVACADLGVYLGFTEAYHLALNFLIAKLYTNSLLSSLNSRGAWARSGSATGDGAQTIPKSTAFVGSRRVRSDTFDLGVLVPPNSTGTSGHTHANSASSSAPTKTPRSQLDVAHDGAELA